MWADQVENGNLQSPLLSYAMAKEGTVNSTSIVPTVESTHVPHAPESSNTSMPQGIESSVIPYAANQPANP